MVAKLFNLVMDELLDEIEAMGIGAKVDNKHVPIMGFADDLVLLEETEFGMKKLLDKCEKFFDEKGLSVNAKKSLSLRTLPVKSKRSFKVVEEAHRWWKGVPLPSADHNKLMRYLGVNLNPLGEVVLPLDLWETWFERIRRAHLKPAQRIWSIRTIIIPRMMHQLRLADVGISKLKILNRLVRKNFKLFLHLPEWTPDSWILLRGGGNLGDITSAILKARKKASTKMANSNDNVTATIGTVYDNENDNQLRKLGLQDHSVAEVSKKIQQDAANKLAGVTNGEALLCMSQSTVKRDWLWYSKTVQGGDVVLAARMLSGTLPTRLNLSRGCKGERNVLCLKCHLTAETDIHIFNVCNSTKLARCKRHNNTADKIAKELKKVHTEATIIRERTYRAGLERLKPDITMFEDDVCTFIELTIPYEKNKETLNRRENEKEEKYKTLTVANLLGQIPSNIRKTEVIGIAIGSAGTIVEQTKRKLRKLKILTHARNFSLTTCMGSISIWKRHSESNPDDDALGCGFRAIDVWT